MSQKNIYLTEARRKLMSNRKVVCTGNPDRPGTLASGFKKIFPDATFLCRTTGWDLSDRSTDTKEKLKSVFAQHNTFINSSYIDPYVQSYLLQTCFESVKFCDVINIGSTHEYDGLAKFESYMLSKIDLRDLSLKLNSFRFSTSHLIVGGIKNNSNLERSRWLDIDKICEIPLWIWSQPFLVPIMSIDQFKEAW